MSDNDKRLRELCELTVNEEDPEKLAELARKLNQALESREQELLKKKKAISPAGKPEEITD